MILLSFLTFDGDRDFPYYRNNPRLSKKAWFVLMLLIPISFIGSVIFDNELVGSIFFCFTLLIPLLYFSNWDYDLLFHRPTRNELILAVLMFVVYMVYSIAMGSILEIFQMVPAGGESAFQDIDIISLISLLFSMMGEELLKFIPLMFFMRVFYKFTSRRNLSFIASMILVLVFFAFLHYDPATTSIASVLLVQGVGSLVEMYGYAKTKNLFVPYISHLLTDAFVFAIILLGF